LLREHPEFRRALDSSYWCIAFNENCIAYQFDEPPQDAEPEAIKVAMIQWGVLDSESGAEMIGGWAWDSSRPDVPVHVEIYDGEEKIATVPADEFRQDLADAGIGNGKHGFFYATPASLKDPAAHTLSAKIAGTGIHLTNSPMEFRWREVAAVEGVVDACTAEYIDGWAWDRARPDDAVVLDIYDDNERIAQVTASVLREDLRDAGFGNGKHGFVFVVDPPLKNDRAHTVSVKVSGHEVHLANSPVVLESQAPPS